MPGENPRLLKQAFEKVKAKYPFIADAIVYLPDHLHCLWTLPPGDNEYSKRWMLIKSTFTRSCHDPFELEGKQTIKMAMPLRIKCRSKRQEILPQKAQGAQRKA